MTTITPGRSVTYRRRLDSPVFRTVWVTCAGTSISSG